MPSEDISSYVKSTIDFYDLLSIPLAATQKELDRAWRRTALKYHPDKVGADPVAKEKFHLAQIGYDLLSSPESKQIYDNAREARIQKQRQDEQLEGRRRDMVKDLEGRERKAGEGQVRGTKRAWEEMDAEARLVQELGRIAEDGKRRRKEREEALRKDLEEEREKEAEAAEREKTDRHGASVRIEVSETDRSVKVLWAAEGSKVSEADLTKLFSKFGDLETTHMLPAKMTRLKGSKKKQQTQRCVLQYQSIVGAVAAVDDFSKQAEPQWQAFDSVQWLTKEPEFVSNGMSGNVNGLASDASTGSNGISTAAPAPRRFDGASAPSGPSRGNIDEIIGKPSFASFSAATPKLSSFGKGTGASSPSLEEMTMLRLRKLEKKRLEAELEQQDREADEVPKSAASTVA